MRTVRRAGGGAALLVLAVFGLAVFQIGSTRPAGTAEPLTSIIVELSGAEPVVVAAERARRAGAVRGGAGFDPAAQERAVRGTQEAFLARLLRAGIDFRVTETALRLAGGLRAERPNRFAHLVNAIGLEVPAAAVAGIRGLPGVRHVSLDRPVRLHLDHSVPYVRASDGPGHKTIFTQGGGPPARFDGTGQVIAVLDSGIEHSHPAFDTRFGDAEFASRSGDARPVRLGGAPYVEGVNHPKVVYALFLTATTNEDDIGHGTHGAADAAGLKVKGPGLDRIPGNADDQIVEGVAPGALLMNYKICETIFSCVGTVNIVTALEDAVSPTDPLGFPKPVATVINMSFGGEAGDPDGAEAVAANNAALAGAVPVASAGNSGSNENTLGSPAAGRRVIAVAAANDPGAADTELDVLAPDAARYTGALGSTGAQNDAGRPAAPEDLPMKAILMGGAPEAAFPLGQHYVYAGFADTPDQVPPEVSGRIALASRGSTVDLEATGTGLFGHKAAEAAAKGAVALLVFNNVDEELEAATTQAAAIPVYGVSMRNGLYLRDILGFQNPAFDPGNPATWGTISNLPLRITPPDPANYTPSTTSFSSRGPLDNFQFLKPDVTAPGLNIYAATIPAGGLQVQPLPPAVGGTMSDPSRFISVSGTSFSGPHVAGSAALVREALLRARGQAPLPAADLRSGAAAAQQQAQNAVVAQSLVRAALTNTATNLRERDNETPIPDGDGRTFIHEIGSGLIHVARAADARAVMGTDETNGAGGPDDAASADFLPTWSFGQKKVIGTGDPSQSDGVTVTLQNLSGASGAGTYTLALVDGGGTRGDVTRPIGATPGFTVALGAPSVSLGPEAGSRATFTVTVTADGTAGGLQLAGPDVNGNGATEFLWWVVAGGSNGAVLRMPFYYRAVAEPIVFRPAPFQNAIEDDAAPDQVDGIDQDGRYRLSWTFPAPPAEPPCAYRVEEATTLTPIFSDDASEPLVGGVNSRWEGDAEWISSINPDTGSLAYQAIYHDLGNVALAMSDPLALPPDTRVHLVYDTFQDVEDDFDFAFVEVSPDGGAYETVARHTGLFSGQRVVDLSGYAGRAIKVRFRLESDLLISSPLFLGWFIDNVSIQTANWAAIGTVGASTTRFDVAGRAGGTYHYRIAGIFGPGCDAVGPYSNLRSITVDPGAPQTAAPTADFTAAPNPAQVGQAVTFDGSASSDNDAVGCNPATGANRCIVDYFWSFGDGVAQTTSGPTTTHAYAAPGTYRVTLTVTDDDGESAGAERFVEVTESTKGVQQRVTGGGFIPASGGEANFGFKADRSRTGTLSGHLNYDDRAGRTKVLSERITLLSIDGGTATFEGTCSINKVSGFTFSAVATDDGGAGTGDTFRLRLSNGYAAAGTIRGGSVQIHD